MRTEGISTIWLSLAYKQHQQQLSPKVRELNNMASRSSKRHKSELYPIDLSHKFQFKLTMMSSKIALLLITSVLVQLAACQCPWRKDAVELHSECICDFSPSQTSQLNEPIQAHPINRMSIQCSSVNYEHLLEALKQTASIELPDRLLHISVDQLDENSTASDMVQQLVSQTKLDLLHVSNSSLAKLSNRTFLIKLGSTPVRPTSDGSLLVVAIQSLHLSRCGIREIEEDAFLGLQWTLSSLSLSDNLLEHIPVRALERLTRLRVLDLSNNRLVSIRAGSFSRLNRLTTLRLADNRMATMATQVARPDLTLSELTFVGLEDCLIDLNLKNTQLASFPAEAIRRLHKLAFLNLAQNQIANIPSKSFSQMNSLTAINLERNRISSLEEETFVGIENSLSSLSLLGNLLDTYPVGQLSRLSNLRRLDLGFNNIEGLPHNAFLSNKRLILIALDGNPLETLPEATFKPLEGSLRGMSVGGKLLNCDCRLSWMLRWQREFSLQISSRERSPQFCAKPHYLRSLVSFNALKPEHLVCNQDKADFSIDSSVPTTLARALDGLSTSSWLANQEVPTSYFTLPAEIGPVETMMTTVLQPRRESSSRMTTSSSLPIAYTTTSPPPETTSFQTHQYRDAFEPASQGTTDLTMLMVDSPTTSNLLHQLETSATTLQFLHNGVGNLPDDELFAAVEPQRKLNRQGYVHHSQRIRVPAKDLKNSTVHITTTVEPPNHISKARSNTSTLGLEPGSRISRPSPYSSFGNRATNLTLAGQQLPTRIPSKASNKTSTAIIDQTLAPKGARFVDEPQNMVVTEANISARPKNRSSLKPQAHYDTERESTTMQTIRMNPPIVDMDLHRVVEPIKITPTVASTSGPPVLIPAQTTPALPNNTRMSVSSIYRLAVSSSKSSSTTAATSTPNFERSISPTRTTTTDPPTTKTSKHTGESELMEPIAKVRVATTVRMVTSSTSTSSPVSKQIDFKLVDTSPPVTSTSTLPTVVNPVTSSHKVVTVHEVKPAYTGTIVGEHRKEAQLTIGTLSSSTGPPDIASTEISQHIERKLDSTSLSPTLTSQHIGIAETQQDDLLTSRTDRKSSSVSMAKPTGSLQVSPRMLGRIVNLADFDQIALILAAILCFVMFLVAITFTCLCYTNRGNSTRVRERTTLDMFPGASKQQLRESFESSLGSSSSTEYNSRSNPFCCFSSKSVKTKHRRRFAKRSLAGEDDTSSGAGSAGSGAQKSSVSDSSATKSTTLLTPDNFNYPSFATVGKGRRNQRKVQVQGRHKLTHSFDNRALQPNGAQLSGTSSLQAMNHTEAIIRHREAQMANLDYLTASRRSVILGSGAEVNKVWTDRHNSGFRTGSASSISCDSDKSCSPGANRNNHYNISEAHRVYLSDTGLPVDAAMFVSTSNPIASSSTRVNGLLKTLDVYQQAECLSSDKSTTDDSRAALTSQQAQDKGGPRRLSCRFDPQLTSEFNKRRASQNNQTSLVPNLNQHQTGQEPSRSSEYEREDHLNLDLVPMSAEDHWPEPYVDPLTASEPESQSQVSNANLPNSNQLDLQTFQEKIRSHDVSASSARSQTHRRTSSSSHRPSAYDDAYLSNWHTMNRVTTAGRQSSRLISQDDEPSSRLLAGGNSGLLRYRSIPSLNGEGSSRQLGHLPGATNWLRWTPTGEIRPSLRAPVILSSTIDDMRQRGKINRGTTNQRQEVNSRSWFGENQLEAIYVAPTSQAQY